MPRLSAAASSLALVQGQAAIAPPRGLTAAERKVFEATVASVKVEHFAPEDVPLLVTYCATVAQERIIAAELAEATEEEDIDRGRLALSRAAGDLIKLARALRLGPMARDATNRRRPGTIRSVGRRPWDFSRGGEAG